MPATLLRRRLVPALALAVVATTATALPSSAADPTAADRAATWLAAAVSGAGTVVGSYPGDDGLAVTYTDYGRTLDAAIALLAAGGHDDVVGRALTSVTSPEAVGSYVGDGSEVYAGATAKLAFLVEATGGDATKVGGVDLLQRLRDRVTPATKSDGSADPAAGQLTDKSAYGNYAGLFAQAFGVLAFDTAGVAEPAGLVEALTAAQCANGAFPLYFAAKDPDCTPSVDATGLALQALAAVDQAGSTAARTAADWLQSQQRETGGFPGESPVNATGYAAAGLIAVGADVRTAHAYLAGRQDEDGGLNTGAATTSDVFATAQALPALAGKTFQAAAHAVTAGSIACTTAVTTLSRRTITAGQSVVVTLKATSGSTVDLVGYVQPSTTFGRITSLTAGQDGTVQVLEKWQTSTRLYAQQRGCAAGSRVTLYVRSALTLAAKRAAARDYTFSGTAVPARAGQAVSVYRRTADGEVLVGRAKVASTGRWSVRHVFRGTGRVTFVARTAQDAVNAAGASAPLVLTIR